MKTPISGLFPGEINQYFDFQQRFRGTQVFKSIHSNIANFLDISTLPKETRIELDSKAVILSSKIIKEFKDSDSTIKLQIQLYDKNIIETVLLKDNRGRKTACISSQAGCNMGCEFCKTGKMGLLRNLYDYEIVEQFLHLKSIAQDISNIVFMGMGEPLANFNNLKKAIKIFNHPEGPGISYRKQTISTCGLTSGIKKLADEGIKAKLAMSLNSADPEKRIAIMPITVKESLNSLKEALLYYQKHIKNRITLEYVLLKGINDRPEDIKHLKIFITGLKSIINIIPFNQFPGTSLCRPSFSKVKWFINELKNNNIPVSQRMKRGEGINGACGQLGKCNSKIIKPVNV